MFVPKPLYFKRSLPEGIVRQEEIDPSLASQMILDEAEKLGIEWEIIPDTDIIKLTHKNNIQTFRNRAPSTTNYTGVESCYDKQLCKVMLKKAGLQVAPGYAVYKTDSDKRIKSMWEDLKKPLVLKPARGSHGNGVEMDIKNFSDCLKKIRAYFKSPRYPGALILEEMFTGYEYRITASKEKVLGIMERVPGRIIGDGKHSIDKLIQIENVNPLRNISKFLYPHILLDKASLRMLKEQNFTPKSVPRKGEHVQFQKIPNMLAGGITIDRTNDAHKSVKEIALQAVRAIPGLSWAGIDYMTTDLYAPQTKKNYLIVEMNSTPEFAMHDIPMHGKSRGIAKEFLYLMFPELR